MKYYEIDVMHELDAYMYALHQRIVTNIFAEKFILDIVSFNLGWHLDVIYIHVLVGIAKSNFKTLNDNNNPCRNRYK